MAETIVDLCTHEEQVGTARSPMPHQFRARPAASQAIFSVGGGSFALRAGDRFENEASPDHRTPRAGSFLRPPSGAGEFVDAGQDLLRLSGRAVVVRSGALELCCELRPRRACSEAAWLGARPLLLVDGQPVLTGRRP